MFDFLKKSVRAASHEGEPTGPQSPLERLHLRLGAFVTFDTLPFRMHREALLFAPPESGQKIEAYGRVDLGASAELHRYYFTDDAWLQVNTTAGQVDEFKLWIFHDTHYPGTRAAFDRFITRDGPIGAATFEYAGKQFRRVWGEDEEWSPPIQFVEEVHTESPTAVAYYTVHHAMLFEREVEGADRMEYLLISAELTDEEYAVVYNIGMDVSETDFQVT